MKWVNRFYEMATLVASWSKDPTRKVGAVIFKGNTLISTGFNGYPSKIKDNALDSKELKRTKTVHAEVNAILRADKSDLENASIVVTHHPCAGCATLIIAAGIAHVYCARPAGAMLSYGESFEQASCMFDEAGVKLTTIYKG